MADLGTLSQTLLRGSGARLVSSAGSVGSQLVNVLRSNTFCHMADAHPQTPQALLKKGLDPKTNRTHVCLYHGAFSPVPHVGAFYILLFFEKFEKKCCNIEKDVI